MDKSPKNWPPDVQWIQTLEWSKGIPREVQDAFSKRSSLVHLEIPVKDVGISSGSKSKVRIVMITDPSHPAFGQRGLVSTIKIPPRSHILDYMGIVHSESTASPSSDYSLSFDRRFGLSIDAEKSGNEARMINDYRGVPKAQRATVEFQVYRDFRTGVVRMGIFSLSKPIAAGKELLLSYGKGFWQARDAEDLQKDDAEKPEEDDTEKGHYFIEHK